MNDSHSPNTTVGSERGGSDETQTTPITAESYQGGLQDNAPKPESGWKAILEYGKADDDKTLGEWKDELANLLTFTGLFSAVVTGFVALTLPMLQEDSAATSVLLLAQISQQLASYSVGAQFVNSTVQPVSSEPFVPDQRVIQLNVLWVVSLTLSVMAAFFTITVQQWLRRIPLPLHLTVREAVRLWRLRRFGLIAWKVPTIISLLPVLVQLSVVLFLVGLYLLLETLNETTARVLLIFGSSSLGLFVVTAALPLLFSTCPYKSPVVPAVISMTQLSAVPVIVAVGLCGLILGNFIIIVIQAVLLTSVRGAGLVLSTIRHIMGLFTDCAANSGATLRNQTKQRTHQLSRLRIKILALGFQFTEWVDHTSMTVVQYIASSSTLWDRWELRYVSRHPKYLDCNALSWVYARASPELQEDPHLLISCLKDIPDEWRPTVGVSSISKALLARHRDVSMLHPPPACPVFINASSNLPKTVSEFEGVLWESLPRSWTLYEDERPNLQFHGTVASVLSLLYRNNVLGWAPDKAPSESSVTKIGDTLAAIRAHQGAIQILKGSKQRIPTVLLFGCCLRGYTLSESVMQDFVTWTIDIFRALPHIPKWSTSVPKKEAYKIPLCDIVLGTLAIALMGCSSERALEAGASSADDDELSEMLQQCALFLDAHYKDISFITRITAFIPDGRHILITAQSLASIANSIARLTSNGRLGKSPDCASHEVAGLLRTICDRAHGDELADTERFLDILSQIVEEQKPEASSWNRSPVHSPTIPDQFFIPIEPQHLEGVVQT